MYRDDFTIARYISIERIVEQTRDSYYAALRTSSEGWHEGKHSLVPWTDYFLGILIAAYRELDQRLGTLDVATKAERVKLAIQQLPDAFTVAEVERACPGVSRATIKLAMKELRLAGEIENVRAGRGALWRKVAAGP